MPRQLHLQKLRLPTASVKWKTAWTNSASIWRAAEETLRTGRNRRRAAERQRADRKSTRLNSSHLGISYAVFCLKKKKKRKTRQTTQIIVNEQQPNRER